MIKIIDTGNRYAKVKQIEKTLNMSFDGLEKETDDMDKETLIKRYYATLDILTGLARENLKIKEIKAQ